MTDEEEMIEKLKELSLTGFSNIDFHY